MSVNDMQFVRDYANRMAPMSQRQMPVFSQVGKGLRGNNAKVELTSDGVNSKLVGKYFNQLDDTESTLWQLPLINLVPKLHYQVWEGVREIDGVNMCGYYIHYECEVTIENEAVTLWSFDTPFTMTHPFNGDTVPADTMTDSDE